MTATKQAGSEAPCGWCITGDHDKCKTSVSWDGRTWACACAARGHTNQPKEGEQ